MTIRKNEIFSELILLQSKQKQDSFDLRAEASVLRMLHPMQIRGILDFIDNPEREATQKIIPFWNYTSYPTSEEAKRANPVLASKKAFPYVVWNFMKGNEDAVILDFDQLGAAILSRTPLNHVPGAGLHTHLMYPLIDYAVSQDLWGPHGKWPRFHDRILKSFDKLNLLSGNSFPGKYVLIASAKDRLESKGIKGSIEDKNFSLTLPWTFALSDLIELERIIEQGL